MAPLDLQKTNNSFALVRRRTYVVESLCPLVKDMMLFLVAHFYLFIFYPILDVLLA